MSPEQVETIALEDLHPGDIVLCAGDDWESRTIIRLDGGTYSHAALYIGRSGELKAPAVIQAGRKGVHTAALPELVGMEAVSDVYRWRSKDELQLGEPGYPAGPVLEVARKYVSEGTRYSYQELLFVVILILARKEEVPKRARWLLAAALSLLDEMLEHGKHMVVCSELVYLCFEKAPPDGWYDFAPGKTALRAGRRAGPVELEEIGRRVTASLERAGHPVSMEHLERLSADADLERKVLEGIEGIRRHAPAVADGLGPLSWVVSPRTLETSPSLRLLGRLAKPAHPRD